MTREVLFELASPYRDSFRIQGFRFGSGHKTCAIVGAMRGDEVQQQFICAQIVKNLRELEEAGRIAAGREILVIPCVNNFSMNISKRFWAMDNTDINRMFPGYDRGETTQRIAAALFEAIKGYEYGLHFTSFYIHGEFIPHVRVMVTGYQDIEGARKFGLKYTLLRRPSSFDTTVLNYNWQIFGTRAFSVYSGNTDILNKEQAKTAWQAALRFLAREGAIDYPVHAGYISEVIEEAALVNVPSERGGILYRIATTDTNVKRGDLLAKILDPYDGATLSQIRSPVSGIIFFSHDRPLVTETTTLFRIAAY